MTRRDEERADELRRFGPRRTDHPEPGFFAVRLRKGAVEVAARIEHRASVDPETGEPLDRSLFWFVTIDGEPDPDPRPLPGERVWRVWHSGRRVDEAEFRFLTDRSTWAAHHDPGSPEATPTEPVNLSKMEPLF